MQIDPRRDAYSPREIALAACVPEEHALAVIGRRGYVPYPEALRVARTLRHTRAAVSLLSQPLFSLFASTGVRPGTTRVPLVLSSTLHVGLVALVVLVTTLTTVPTATTLTADRPEPTRLVFLAEPGPGGGGGGGGRLQTTPAPVALRRGQRPFSSPMPIRVPPRPTQPVAALQRRNRRRSTRSRYRLSSRPLCPHRTIRETASAFSSRGAPRLTAMDRDRAAGSDRERAPAPAAAQALESVRAPVEGLAEVPIEQATGSNRRSCCTR